MSKIQKPIYLDYQATTPCDPCVLEEMIPYFTEKFGNPHSRNHSYGWDAENAVDESRKKIADLIGADKTEIIFTSGATESNNLALKGVAEFYKESKNHIITTSIEHKCVLETCRNLEQFGFEVTYLPVDKKGFICLESLKKSITNKTSMVSVIFANNEIGVIQQISEIGKICRENKIFFHTDAAQAFGKIPIDVLEMNIDLMSISGHKIYGPKGIGALYVGKKPRVRLKAQMNGGGQERGMRSGTLSPALCVGLGKASYIAQNKMEEENIRIKGFKDYMFNTLKKNLKDIYLNGDYEKSLSGNLNISFAYVEGEGLMMGLKDLAVSSGSACTSSSLESSYVLRELGVKDDLSHTSLRIGFGRFTTFEEIKKATDLIIKEVRRLREMSPLWEMAQQGIDIKSIEWSGH